MTAEVGVAIVVTALEMPLVVFNVLVTTCVVRRLMRSDPKFSAGFYTVFALQSGADILNYLVGPGKGMSTAGLWFSAGHFFLSTSNGIKFYFSRHEKHYSLPIVASTPNN